jgi:tmRNA-binding protein
MFTADLQIKSKSLNASVNEQKARRDVLKSKLFEKEIAKLESKDKDTADRLDQVILYLNEKIVEAEVGIVRTKRHLDNVQTKLDTFEYRWSRFIACIAAAATILGLVTASLQIIKVSNELHETFH